MSLPPVVERELRVTSRKPVTYWGRAGAGASGVVVICFVMAAHLANAPLPVIGQITFRLLATMTAVTVMVSVLQLASEAFAREKREDTLGLLFLTPLQPIDMVVGKLVSTSLSAFYRFLAVVPVLAVPMLAGGVSATDFVLLVLGLLNLNFLGATIGLCVSAKCWDEKRAVSWASSIMIVLVGVPAVIWLGTGRIMSGPSLAIAAGSPGFAIWQAVMPGTRSTSALAGSLVWTQLLGWIFFYAACRTLPLCWQKQPGSISPKGDHLQPKIKPESKKASKSISVRKAKRRQFSIHERIALLGQNPLAWFAARWKPPASATWGIAAIGAICFVPGVLAGVTVNDWSLLFEPGYALLGFFVINIGIKTFAAHQASFAFARDRGEDTLDLLLSTPITMRQLIDGHAHALSNTLRPILRRALWIEGAWFAITLGIHIQQRGEHSFLYAFGSAAMLGLLIPDSRALATTAMWQSVIKKNAREAQHETFSKLVFLPWLLAILVWALGAVLGNVQIGLVSLIASWVLASTAANIYFANQSRRYLQSRLTLWAVRRAAGEFEHYDGWKHLGRTLGRWWSSQRNTSQPLTRKGDAVH